MSKKVKKVFQKLKKTIKHLNKNISIIHQKSNKLYAIIFFDILWCEIIYGSSSDEYKNFEFYSIDSSKRETYLTKCRYQDRIKYLYKKETLSIINNKNKFIQKFKKQLNREVSNLNDISYKAFEDIILQNKKILCRNDKSSFTLSHEIYDLTKFRSPGYVLKKINDDKLSLVEKTFYQHKLFNAITENLVILNIVTLKNKNSVGIVSSSINFKEDGKLLKGFVDIKKGTTKGHLRYEDYTYYKDKVINYEIPLLDEAKELARSLAEELSEIREIEWSFCITNRGTIYLMDADIWTNQEFAQLPEFLNNRVGLLPYYKKALKGMRKI